MEKAEMTGRRYGMLTVISRVPYTQAVRSWKCLCDCGNEVIVSQDDLFWGSASNCGCKRDDDPGFRLEGNKYGRLTVIREVDPIFSPEETLESVWLCRCKCGRKVVVPRNKLLSGDTLSCGCTDTPDSSSSNQEMV